MYRPIDLQSPLVAQWTGILLLVAGLAVIAHGMWRRRRYQQHRDLEDARYAGPDRLKDSVREILAGVGVAVIGLGAVAYAIFGTLNREEAIQDNVAQKYGVESVDGKQWEGNGLRADVTMPDGTVHQDVLITFEESGEPEISGDLNGNPGQ
ncbi:hypothetical protein [Citricoccus sp. GCM10030269]|uniref:hypothetical protein n=1 Tax=Citricoccus sp. GCM10030269 TaxID=3273388 RepID=UPI00361DE414